MARAAGTAGARWETAGDAIQNALMPLADVADRRLRCSSRAPIPTRRRGASTRPGSRASSCRAGGAGRDLRRRRRSPPPTRSTSCAGAEFLSRRSPARLNAAPLYAPVPGGLTPLKEGLQQAQTALASGNADRLDVGRRDHRRRPQLRVGRRRERGRSSPTGMRQASDTHVIGLPGRAARAKRCSTTWRRRAAPASTSRRATRPRSSRSCAQIAIRDRAARASTRARSRSTRRPRSPDKLHLVVTENGMDLDVARELSADASWNVDRGRRDRHARRPAVRGRDRRPLRAPALRVRLRRRCRRCRRRSRSSKSGRHAACARAHAASPSCEPRALAGVRP